MTVTPSTTAKTIYKYLGLLIFTRDETKREVVAVIKALLKNIKPNKYRGGNVITVYYDFRFPRRPRFVGDLQKLFSFLITSNLYCFS